MIAFLYNVNVWLSAERFYRIYQHRTNTLNSSKKILIKTSASETSKCSYPVASSDAVGLKFDKNIHFDRFFENSHYLLNYGPFDFCS